jgi:hypothetical protein
LRSKRRIKQIPEIFQTRKSSELVIGKSQCGVNAHNSNKLSDYIDLKTSELRKRESLTTEVIPVIFLAGQLSLVYQINTKKQALS